jgi:hypothetical protein
MDRGAELAAKKQAEKDAAKNAKTQPDKSESSWFNPFSWGKKKEEETPKAAPQPLTETTPQTQYEPAPNAPAIDQSDKKVDLMLKMQNGINLEMLKTMQNISKNMENQQGSTTVIHSPQGQSNGTPKPYNYASEYDSIVGQKTSYLQLAFDRQAHA